MMDAQQPVRKVRKPATRPMVTPPLVEIAPPAPSMPPTFWQRWVLLVGALGNVLFFLFYQAGVSVTYAPPMPNDSPPWVRLVTRLLFWGALGIATLCKLTLVLGRGRRVFHLLLNVALGCGLIPLGLFALARLLQSLYLGAGFAEPLFPWMVLAIMWVAIRSAHSTAPAEPVYIPGSAALGRLWLWLRRSRWGAAWQAFTEALHQP